VVITAGRGDADDLVERQARRAIDEQRRLDHQPDSSGDYKMQACLRGPNLQTSERLVTAMLASASIG
jgi:hypothetical protein